MKRSADLASFFRSSTTPGAWWSSQITLPSPTTTWFASSRTKRPTAPRERCRFGGHGVIPLRGSKSIKSTRNPCFIWWLFYRSVYYQASAAVNIGTGTTYLICWGILVTHAGLPPIHRGWLAHVWMRKDSTCLHSISFRVWWLNADHGSKVVCVWVS